MDPQDVIAAWKGAGALLRRLERFGVFTRYTAAAHADKKRLLAEGARDATVIKAEGTARAAMIRASAKNEIAERAQQSKHRMERIQALHELDMADDVALRAMADDVALRAIYGGERERLLQQENLEAIVEGALPELTDGDALDRVADDWLANLLGRCRIVSDKQMQSLWSRVLAGEVNVPGSFSRRTVNAIADLDKYDCDTFARLCRFNWAFNEPFPLILDAAAPIFAKHQIGFLELSHLKTIGLIMLTEDAVQHPTPVRQGMPVRYFDREFMLELPPNHNSLSVGRVTFTRTGSELARIVAVEPIPEFLDYMLNLWSHILKPNAEVPASRPDVTSGEPAVD